MSDIVLSVENVYKRYRLGSIDSQAFKEDVVEIWASFRGKPSPYDTYITSNELATVSDASQVKSRYVWALQDVNFDVKQGEIVGIIGKNGSGKSTLLKILSKTTSPTRGQVKIKGRIASLLEVGTGFHPELTGKQNIYLNGAILGMKKHEITRRLDEIIAFAGIEAFIDTPVKRYSSGMYVRLAFAVAAHLESDILILDEVLAVGDSEFQKKCLGKMNDVSKNEGKTVLFVSHIMSMVEKLCNRVVWLSEGTLKTEGDTTNIIKKYIDAQLKMDFGSNTDIKDYKLRRGDGVVRFSEIKIFNQRNEITNEFYREDTITFKLRAIRFVKKDVDVFMSIAFKAGINQDFVTSASYIPLKIGKEEQEYTEVIVEVPCKVFRTAIYDLYFWIGADSDTPYDVVDGVLPPITILDTKKSLLSSIGYFDVPYKLSVVS